MKWLYRNLYRKEKGFTLVELMIVIIILAILTGIAVPSYMVLRTRARVAAAKSEMKNIATALEMFSADYERYPTDAEWATFIADTPPAIIGPGGGAVDVVTYMSPLPIVDGWATAYGYVSTASTTYTLSCNGGTAVADFNIIAGQPDW